MKETKGSLSVACRFALLAGIGLAFMGCQQAFEVRKGNSPFKQSDFGELPATPDGSAILTFNSLVDAQGRTPQGKVRGSSQESTNTFSQGLSPGDLVNLVAEVITASNKKYFIANADGFEGYIESGRVEVQDIDEGGGTPGTPPAPGTCKVGVTYDYGNKGDYANQVVGLNATGSGSGSGTLPNFPETMRIPGNSFRTASDDMAVVVETAGYVNTITVQVSGYTSGSVIRMPAKSFTVAANETVHKFPFSKVLEKNNWAQMKGGSYTNVSKVVFSVYLNNNSASTFDLPPGEVPPRNENPPPNGTPECGAEGGISSPIVMDFSLAQNFKTLAPAEKMVQFDIDNDGSQESMGWIAPETGFLALDLNGNGRIDGGGELFGEATVLPGGELAPNGYLALSQYLPKAEDLKECTSVIDHRAPIFEKLLVWFDTNLDGQSQPDELKNLKQAGVTAIDTGYSEVPEARQSRGLFDNVVKYQSKFWGPSQCGSKGCHTYDVYFSLFEVKHTLTSR
ncbi:MAG: hypothetical protein H6624_02830 [Bdellovibrionaceae bacterium]|nr:hypothetical protein [Bdellovibrionales bacterium]MCB9083247.1 hypothetical protein [Pseudobdellovibrionaceae bacterium]